MKKKTRTIIVDGEEYVWSAHSKYSGLFDKERSVTVWKDKKVIWRQDVRMQAIAPRHIEQIIREGVLTIQ